jgi:hypothetical protein
MRLVLECSKAAWDYSDAVTIMGSRARASDLKYAHARDAAESRRVVLERVQLILDEHVTEHGCFRE